MKLFKKFINDIFIPIINETLESKVPSLIGLLIEYQEKSRINGKPNNEIWKRLQSRNISDYLSSKILQTFLDIIINFIIIIK